jgi:predicted nucleic acid-binding Zn ribbon protein
MHPVYIYKCAKCGEKGSYYKKTEALTLFCCNCKNMTRHNFNITDYKEA